MNIPQRLSAMLQKADPVRLPGARRGLRGCTAMLRDRTKPSRLTVCAVKRGHDGDHGSTIPGDWVAA